MTTPRHTQAQPAQAPTPATPCADTHEIPTFHAGPRITAWAEAVAASHNPPPGRALGMGTACTLGLDRKLDRPWPVYLETARAMRDAAVSHNAQMRGYGFRYGIPSSGRCPAVSGAPVTDIFGGQHDRGGETMPAGPSFPDRVLGGSPLTYRPNAAYRDRRYRGRSLNARRMARLAGRLAVLVMGTKPRPMSGGSPWASRDTGWHALDCLCRACRLQVA